MQLFDFPNPIVRRDGTVAVLHRLQEKVDQPNALHGGGLQPLFPGDVKLSNPSGFTAAQERIWVHFAHPLVQRIEVILGPKGPSACRAEDDDREEQKTEASHQSASGPWSRFFTIVKMVATATISPSWSSTSTR